MVFNETTNQGRSVVNARHAVHATPYYQWIKLTHFKTLNEVLNHKNKRKLKNKNSSQIFVVKGSLQFELVLVKEPFKRDWNFAIELRDFAIEFRKKIG